MRGLVFLLFVFPSFLSAQIKNVTLLDHWSDSTLISNSSQVRYSGCYSFSKAGHDYAVIGTTEGLHIFQITIDKSLTFIDSIKGNYISSQAITREYAHYNDFLYAIGDEGDASLQIIDLSNLPDSVSLVSDIQDERVGKAHNIYIDSSRALMYLCLVTPIVNGMEASMIPLRVYSLENPLSPSTIFSGFDDLSEVHDFEFKESVGILNCGFQGIRVYDFSIPEAPIYLNNLEFYQEQGYNHQGSLSEDGSIYVFADETPGTRVKKCTVTENYGLQVQQLFGVENTPYDKTAHNIKLIGNLAYVAYYNDGLRIYDLRNNPPNEIAVYDTHTDLPGNEFSMWGAWGIEANASNNQVLISDRISGLYLFEFDRAFFEQTKSPSQVTCYPNPVSSGEPVIVRMMDDRISRFKITLSDQTGKEILIKEIIDNSYVAITLNVAQGTYFLKIEFPEELILQNETLKLIVN